MASDSYIGNCRDHPMHEMLAATMVLRRDGAALLQHRDDKPGL